MSASQFDDSLVHPMTSFTQEKMEATEIYEDDVQFVRRFLEFTHEEKLYLSFHLSAENATLYERLRCNFKRTRFLRKFDPDYVEEPEWPEQAAPSDMQPAFEKAMEAEPLCKEGGTVYIDHRYHIAGSWPTGDYAYIYEIDYLQKQNGVMTQKHFCGFKENAPRHFTFLTYPRPFTFEGTVLQ
jgi:hypothetical protein